MVGTTEYRTEKLVGNYLPRTGYAMTCVAPGEDN